MAQPEQKNQKVDIISQHIKYNIAFWFLLF